MFSNCVTSNKENPDQSFNNFGTETASLTVTASEGSNDISVNVRGNQWVGIQIVNLRHDHAVSGLGNSGQKGVYGL